MLNTAKASSGDGNRQLPLGNGLDQYKKFLLVTRIVLFTILNDLTDPAKSRLRITNETEFLEKITFATTPPPTSQLSRVGS